MNNMTFFDSYVLNENNSIESKNLLVTFAINTNMYYTSLKPLDLIVIKQMLDSNKNVSNKLCAQYFCNLFTKEMAFITILLLHVYYLCNINYSIPDLLVPDGFVITYPSIV